MTPETLAALDHEGFVAAFGEIFEHSPWIAEGAWPRAPFSSFEALHQGMTDVLDAAGPEAAVALVRAHPDLAGKAALAGDIAPESKIEQKASGLSSLTPDEHARFTRLNDAYTAKFGFPFVMAVRKSGKDAILAAFEERLRNDPHAEVARAITEIKTIARLRLEAIAAGGGERSRPRDRLSGASEARARNPGQRSYQVKTRWLIRRPKLSWVPGSPPAPRNDGRRRPAAPDRSRTPAPCR